MSQHQVVSEVAECSALIESPIELLLLVPRNSLESFQSGLSYYDLHLGFNLSWNLNVALGCMASCSPMASACALTMVFNISGHGLSILHSGSWLYYILLLDGLSCSVSCFCIPSSRRACLFLVFLLASMAAWHCFHPWHSLVHWPWFSTSLDISKIDFCPNVSCFGIPSSEHVCPCFHSVGIVFTAGFLLWYWSRTTPQKSFYFLLHIPIEA